MRAYERLIVKPESAVHLAFTSEELAVLTEDVPLIADANEKNHESDNAHNDDSNCLNSFHMLSRFCFNFRCKVKERLTNNLLSDGKFREREENILRERKNSFKEKSQTMSGVMFGKNLVQAYPVRRKLGSSMLAMRSHSRRQCRPNGVRDADR